MEQKIIIVFLKIKDIHKHAIFSKFAKDCIEKMLNKKIEVIAIDKGQNNLSSTLNKISKYLQQEKKNGAEIFNLHNGINNEECYFDAFESFEKVFKLDIKEIEKVYKNYYAISRYIDGYDKKQESVYFFELLYTKPINEIYDYFLQLMNIDNFEELYEESKIRYDKTIQEIKNNIKKKTVITSKNGLLYVYSPNSNSTVKEHIAIKELYPNVKYAILQSKILKLQDNGYFKEYDNYSIRSYGKLDKTARDIAYENGGGGEIFDDLSLGGFIVESKLSENIINSILN
jgi:hypothetical protein